MSMLSFPTDIKYISDMELIELIFELIFVYYLIAGIITGLIGRYIGKQKNRSGWEGFFFGFFLSFFGMIIVALLPTKEAPKKPETPEEDIEAKKLRFQKAQQDNKKTAITFVIVSISLILLYLLFNL